MGRTYEKADQSLRDIVNRLIAEVESHQWINEVGQRFGSIAKELAANAGVTKLLQSDTSWDSEIGMTMGDTIVNQLPDGTWKVTCQIGTIFGSELDRIR